MRWLIVMVTFAALLPGCGPIVEHRRTTHTDERLTVSLGQQPECKHQKQGQKQHNPPTLEAP